ncbi:hypothetical protein M595_1565 [Lyngbya aestuarii BL J]|uniref:Uncharacterized protein n=1 Tax=Lyngbya aestuarii BL J TaxID=1348334 RepID=U7QKQ6_9CYAN|nr:hypothetical protein M595_1565 [Lyngbya aestuarii BL J]
MFSRADTVESIPNKLINIIEDRAKLHVNSGFYTLDIC